MACWMLGKERKRPPNESQEPPVSEVKMHKVPKSEVREVVERSSTSALSQASPICSLPVELVQYITTFLKNSEAASFSLSSRYICYAIGTDHLTKYLSSATSRIAKRMNIEIIERAFPSHWFCAWCEGFHRYELGAEPKNFEKEAKRDCVEFNSYLHDGKDFVVAFHHVRSAVNRALWGPEFGIPLSVFDYTKEGTTKIFKISAPTSLQVSANIVSSSFLLHTAYSITLPLSVIRDRRRNILAALWPTLPQILVGHRDSQNGHTGLKHCLENAIMGNWIYGVQLCSVCATDYKIYWDTTTSPLDTTTTTTLHVQTYRNLGSVRTPFDTSWRAHGEIGHSRAGFGGSSSDILRLTTLQAGEIKKAFESGRTLRHVPAGSVGAGPRPASPNTAAAAIYQRPASTLDSVLRMDFSGEVGRSRARRGNRSVRGWDEGEYHLSMVKWYREREREVQMEIPGYGPSWGLGWRASGFGSDRGGDLADWRKG